jgi:hypothetical protein
MTINEFKMLKDRRCISLSSIYFGRAFRWNFIPRKLIGNGKVEGEYLQICDNKITNRECNYIIIEDKDIVIDIFSETKLGRLYYD